MHTRSFALPCYGHPCIFVKELHPFAYEYTRTRHRREPIPTNCVPLHRCVHDQMRVLFSTAPSNLAVVAWEGDDGVGAPLALGCHVSGVRLPLASRFPLFLTTFPFYEVVSLHRCVIPYKYRKLLEMLVKLRKLFEIMGWPHLASCTL